MRTHGALTEHSRSYPVVTHDRKGREGKGREIGREFQVQGMHVPHLCACGKPWHATERAAHLMACEVTTCH